MMVSFIQYTTGHRGAVWGMWVTLPRGKVEATRGLRWGDPLSPFLGLLVLDVLSRIVCKCVEGNILTLFEVGEDKAALSHLQFVDDMIFFCFGSEDLFLILNHILAFFEEISGLRINRGKCSVMGINCDEEKLKRWSKLVGSEIGGLPSSYLGQLVSLLEVTLRRLLYGTSWWIRWEVG